MIFLRKKSRKNIEVMLRHYVLASWLKKNYHKIG